MDGSHGAVCHSVRRPFSFFSALKKENKKRKQHRAETAYTKLRTFPWRPTSSSWLNLVERFFADLTEDVIRTGSFASVNELVRDIVAYLAQRNANPRPYKWKAEGAAILDKIKRARAALEKAQAA